MINFYGIFQLVDVVKSDTTKNGNTVVYFKAASNSPGKTKGDIKFFKIYGKTAEYMMKNLRKKDNNKYASRRMFLSGYLETYTKEETIKLTKTIPKTALDKKLGVLYEDINIEFSKKDDKENEIFSVSQMEFADSKVTNDEINIIANSSSYSMSDDSTAHESLDTNHSISDLNNMMSSLQDETGDMPAFNTINDL